MHTQGVPALCLKPAAAPYPGWGAVACDPMQPKCFDMFQMSVRLPLLLARQQSNGWRAVQTPRGGQYSTVRYRSPGWGSTAQCTTVGM